ncbi:hypothetical protein Sru01_09030 [Sphaerisporangium rufum]|uniref:DUF397 domain-containing protein n=1 Tax=Sphaerisporangium rufum TaxID=1381558 RepID=A0A919QXH2_9ACTN|nr:DUF397 domain-containing protein [Sphaerisporangium rufum]GII75921.1 hypothetical protein Sru01_09030 [Sphaerisporangium rufum]
MDRGHVTAADLSTAVWRKSVRSGNNGAQCVEVATGLPRVVAVRDSKRPGGPVVLTTRDRWRSFLDGVRSDTLEDLV